MSEEQKVDKAKPKLPTKTRIAKWWLIVVGVILIIFYFVVLGFSIIYSFDSGPTEENIQPAFILFLGSIFYLISGIFISKKTKLAWIVAVTILFTVAAFSLGTYIYFFDTGYGPVLVFPGILIYLTPLILIILDRKKFLEMVRLRDLAEKDGGNLDKKQHYYINRMMLVALFLLALLFYSYYWAIFKLPDLQNENLSIYVTAKGYVQEMVKHYQSENNGNLPTINGTVTINGKAYDIIDLCAILININSSRPEAYYPQYFAITINGSDNDNCDSGCNGCWPQWYYIWAVDKSGKVYSTCMGDGCSAHNQDGFQDAP